MQIVPLTAVPSQTFSISLGAQQCQISVYEKSTGMFLDLIANNLPVVTAALCLNGVGLIRQPYLGFIGQLAFVDTQGASDPSYSGLGSRFILTYQ